MGTFGLASLRFPAALAASLSITGVLFWTLWSFTDKTFVLVETAPIKIDFKRIVEESPPPKPEQEKVMLEKPIEIVEPPFIPGGDKTGVEVAITRNIVPVLDIAPDSRTMGTDTEAVPMFRVQPIYPPRAAASNTEGWVLVQFNIGASGAVTNVVAVDSEPGTTFDKAATDAVARWRYNPSVVNGQAVDRIGVQTMIRFNLEDVE